MLGRMPVDIWSQDPSLSKRTLVCEQKDTRTHYEDSRSSSYILKKKIRKNESRFPERGEIKLSLNNNMFILLLIYSTLSALSSLVNDSCQSS